MLLPRIAQCVHVSACRLATRLVPRLVPREECSVTPLQVCSRATRMVRLTKPATSRWCGDTGSLGTGSLDTDSLGTGSLDTGSLDTDSLDTGSPSLGRDTASRDSAVGLVEESERSRPAAAEEAEEARTIADPDTGIGQAEDTASTEDNNTNSKVAKNEILDMKITVDKNSLIKDTRDEKRKTHSKKQFQNSRIPIVSNQVDDDKLKKAALIPRDEVLKISINELTQDNVKKIDQINEIPNSVGGHKPKKVPAENEIITTKSAIEQDNSNMFDAVNEVDDDEDILSPFDDLEDTEYPDTLTDEEKKDLDEFNVAIQLELFRAKVDNDFPRQDFSDFVDVEAF